MAEGVAGDRIAIQHHGAGDSTFEERLQKAGAMVLPHEVYRWGESPDPQAAINACISVAAGEYDAVLFTSAPAALAFLAIVEAEGITEIVRNLVANSRLMMLAVGPVTAAPLADAMMIPTFPERSRMGAMVRQAIVQLGEEAPQVEQLREHCASGHRWQRLIIEFCRCHLVPLQCFASLRSLARRQSRGLTARIAWRLERSAPGGGRCRASL